MASVGIPLAVVLLSLAGLGAYLGRHGLADGRWSSYALIYGFGVGGVTAWLRWAELFQSVHFGLVFPVVLLPVALWGWALVEPWQATDLSRRQRLRFTATLVLILPLGLIQWAAARTRGRSRVWIFVVTAAACLTALWMAAASFWPPFQIPAVVQLSPPTWRLLALLLVAMVALGAYLGGHGLHEADRWGGYAVIFAAGFFGFSTWAQWSSLGPTPVFFDALSAVALAGVALWGAALADVWRATDMPLRPRVALAAVLLLLPPAGVIDWAMERTRGRFQSQVIVITTIATMTTVTLAAYVAWNRTHSHEGIGGPAGIGHLIGPSPR
jgi:hypothetical protein